MRYLALALASWAGVCLAGCTCSKPPPDGAEQDGGSPQDAGDSGSDSSDSGTADSGSPDSGTPDSGTSIDDPKNEAKDTDCDGLSDAEEFSRAYPGGKKTDPANPDSDGDGIKDGVEVGQTSSVAAGCAYAGDADPQSRTQPTDPDSDGDGLSDGLEDANQNGARETSETDPRAADSDSDGLKDGEEDASKNGSQDPGETHPLKADSDGDGANDGVERNVMFTDPLKADTDGDTCLDPAEDLDRDGTKDPGETNPKLATDCGPVVTVDTDGDGLSDKVEDANRNGVYEPAAGETNWQASDTDGDGLSDGLEDQNKNGAADPGETNPRTADSDGDGLSDGVEDKNKNGTVDAGETDPLKPDTDGDGVSDGREVTVMLTDPLKLDTDGDSCSDGAEDLDRDGVKGPFETDPKVGTDCGPNSTVDTDGDGLYDRLEDGNRNFAYEPNRGETNWQVADTDGDGLSDGAEDKNKNGTVDAGETNPRLSDTDGDGLSDGAEDKNKNGSVDAGETDPLKLDTDGDGARDGLEVTVMLTDPLKADTDGDSCSDTAEDFNRNGLVDFGETNPKLGTDCGQVNNPDADGDGLPDAVEDKNKNGVYEPAQGETNWQAADTDLDGLPDGIEDKNKNGFAEPGETDPRRMDSDCDGLIDGPAAGGVQGEDQDADAVVDPAETDPTRFDTDGDGIRDGVEAGVTVNPDPANCPGFVPDADPATTTSGTVADSDGDNIPDGAEDANQNGKVDPGELDPKNAADGTGPAGQACAANNLRPVVFRQEGQPDVQLGLPATFTELASIVQGGATKGLMGYDPTQKVAFLVLRLPAPGGAVDPTADEAAIRPTLGGVAALSNVLTQTFTTWDAFPALQAFYEQAGSADLKTRANDLANALVGAGAGSLAGLSGTVGPFKLQAEYVHRSNTSVVVLIALTPLSNYAEPAIFTVSDTAGGSALAQFGDGNAVQCETFAPGTSQVDFLFVVDDSCSMASSQNELGNTATAMANALNNSSLDWRVGMVTSAYYQGTATNNNNTVRGFTRNINELRAWLTQGSTCSGGNCTSVPQPAPCNPTGGTNGGCWVSTSGTGNEQLLQSGRRAVNTLTPASATELPGKIRSGATLVVVLVGDADDQSTNPVQEYVDFFNNTGANPGVTKNNASQKITVHGIVCPPGANCNAETQNTPQRHGTVITATGGVRGSICERPGGALTGSCDPALTNASISNASSAIVNAAIAAAGKKLQKPPIGASIKVAMNAVENPAVCNLNDLPRSRVNGFDFDGVNRTLSFFGGCRASLSTTAAAVSYRYWTDVTPNPNGNPPPCYLDPYFDPNDPDFCKGRLVCNVAAQTCECPAGCGATPPPGKACNPSLAVCDFVCIPDCGNSCNAYQTCNSTNCACECKQNATCAPGYAFVNNGTTCGCICDAAALNCPAKATADLNACACICPAGCGGNPPVGTVCNPGPTVCDFVCTSDCGATCTGFQTCNITTCSCECSQSASCPAGYKFVNSGGSCGCVCDAAALNCPAKATADLNACACVCPTGCGGTPPAGQVCNPSPTVCDFVCTSDCGGACSAYQTCNTASCACECNQTASCPPGQVFVSSGTSCGCVCDPAALACGSSQEADLATCACVCKSDCGGCPAGTSCNRSACECKPEFN